MALQHDNSEWVIMAQATKGAGVAHVIRQAVASPNTYVFGEILALPQVNELKGHPEHGRAHDLLSLFAHGTYLDYKAHREQFPELSPSELHKLKELTVLTFACERKMLAYDELLQQLDISDVRQLEDLLIDAITHGLINAKLDQSTRHVEILATMGRDIRPDDVAKMLAILKKWSEDTEKVIATLNEVQETTQKSIEERATAKKDLAGRIEAGKAAIKKEFAEAEAGMKGGFLGFSLGDYEMGFGGVDIADFDDYGGARARKQLRRGFGGPGRPMHS
eukprot:TRINITY_DN83646_c0_g1_i1.p1 TRINITY_DN83646_c0_g1~~TRINITY_DN83646_c0_g1_i1.p1  ORF type:complete len:277 (+),score=65.50 TRINITY_DN83646_c0_g1_i1:46-876(+)